MLTLLRRSDKFAPFKKASLANEIMARGYRKSDGPCCTAENFQLDMNGTPGSPWNDSARKVFVEDFLKVGSHKCRDRSKIRAMFRSHFRTVQSHFAKYGVEPDEGDSQPGPSGNAAGEPSNATHGAALQLFQRRYRSAARYTLTKRFLWVLRKLGVDGMSSDEEDDDAPFRRFRAYDVPWRSEAVTKMLRALDALHRRWRRKSSKRGAQPRMRYLANEPTATPTPAVPRLPSNAYKRPWYDDIPSFERDDLNARPTEFDFQVPQAIKTYALLLYPLAV
ncbi:hypothetical protein OH76DRAFT_1366335 [Lentinus brumalis]|uniref:Uncharacterized protein n=1 Tax=Lentinus brumalis TaxID=2498619 RepID=A0A371CJA1_9APHY|nr:hypothetical protein OH76DRAFT_1366335 [Polyporus brumalis]